MFTFWTLEAKAEMKYNLIDELHLLCYAFVKLFKKHFHINTS